MPFQGKAGRGTSVIIWKSCSNIREVAFEKRE